MSGMFGMSDIGYDTLTIIVSTAGLLWLFVRQTNRQFDAQRAETAALRADMAKQFDAQRAETAALRADFSRQMEVQRADFSRQLDAQRADTAVLRADMAKQFDAQRAETAVLRADMAKQLDAQRADFTKQLEAQRADTARQFEALRVEHREGLAQVGERVAELRADFRAVLPRAAAEPAGRPQAPVVAAPQRRED